MRTRIVPAAALGSSGHQEYHLAGTLAPGPRLAVVGSRAAHRGFRDAVEPIVYAAGRRQWSIVSGGALGIDGDAHAAALEAEVPQLAVLPCGPDQPYPPRHVPLFERIAAAPGSGVLFAHGPGTVPCRGMFASRNAIVVGLAAAVVVVEAAARSGTMLTATLARRGRRARAVVSGSPGAAILGAEGAHVLAWDPQQPQRLVRRVDAWLAAVERGDAVEPEPPHEAEAWPEHLQWLQGSLREAGPAGLSLEHLPSPREALVALTEAQVLGLVVERASGRYVAVR
ncbi:MAG: DNA-processing protein DprA [Myxococcota bacterium]